MKNRHKKENKSTKKHRRIFWIFVFFLVVGIGVTSYILLFSAYTRRVEREAIATGTVQEEIYSFKSRRDLLSLTPEVKRAALYGRATEIDYGTYIIPGLNATETQVFGEKNTSSICTSRGYKTGGMYFHDSSGTCRYRRLPSGHCLLSYQYA